VSDELLAALEALPAPAWCEGAVAQPIVVDGAPASDDGWWIAHSEAAPFGDDDGTRFDAKVRDTRRMKTRSATPVRLNLKGVVRASGQSAETPHDMTWLVREPAHVLEKEMLFSGTNYFGNEYSEHHTYRFAAIFAHVPTNQALYD
jgi:hypothetical protein